MSIHTLTDKERGILAKFKENISDIVATLCEYRRHDAWLMQWLRARDLDVQQAEAMIRKHIAFRKDYLDGILEWKVSDIVDEKCTVKVCGMDKNGVLIAMIPVGRTDYRYVNSLGLKSEVLRYVSQFFEQATMFLIRNSTKDRMCTQVTLIMDYEGFSYKQLTYRENVNLFNEFIRILQDNYPEVLKSAYIVNAPKIFEILFALIKPLLSTRTLGKVRIFGNNTKQWRPVLLEHIDPDQLPSQYGGSNTTCRDYRVAYGFDWFSKNEILPEKEMISVTVEPGTKHFVKFTLAKGSRLSWNFRTTDYDIGFSLMCPQGSVTGASGPLTHKNSDEVELFQCSHADSHIHLQKGSILAEKPGSYTLVFDNSFSRFRKKDLHYVALVDSSEALT